MMSSRKKLAHYVPPPRDQQRRLEEAKANGTFVNVHDLTTRVFATLLAYGTMPDHFKALVLINARAQAKALDSSSFDILLDPSTDELIVEIDGWRDYPEDQIDVTTFENNDDMFPSQIAELRGRLQEGGTA